MTRTGRPQSRQTQTRECLLRHANFVANSESPSFEARSLAWEARTLPLSYTRPNHIYFNSKTNRCKGGLCSGGVTRKPVKVYHSVECLLCT